MEFLDITQIKKMYSEGLQNLSQTNLKFWDEDYVVDPEMSDEDNAELVRIHNEKVQDRINAKGTEKGKLNRMVRKEIVKYLVGEYGFTKDKAEYLENWVRSETKSGSLKGYFDSIEVIADFVLGIPD